MRSHAPSGAIRYTPPADDPLFPRSRCRTSSRSSDADRRGLRDGDAAVISVETDTVAVSDGAADGSGFGAVAGVLTPPVVRIDRRGVDDAFRIELQRGESRCTAESEQHERLAVRIEAGTGVQAIRFRRADQPSASTASEIACVVLV